METTYASLTIDEDEVLSFTYQIQNLTTRGGEPWPADFTIVEAHNINPNMIPQERSMNLSFGAGETKQISSMNIPVDWGMGGSSYTYAIHLFSPAGEIKALVVTVIVNAVEVIYDADISITTP